jgi:hypothetical protein
MEAALELAGTTAEELTPIKLDVLAGIPGDELGRESVEEIGVTTGVEELDGLMTILLVVEVESIGGTSGVVMPVNVVVGGLVAVELVIAEVVVANIVVVESVIEVMELVVPIELLVDNDVVLVTVAVV